MNPRKSDHHSLTGSFYSNGSPLAFASPVTFRLPFHKWRSADPLKLSNVYPSLRGHGSSHISCGTYMRTYECGSLYGFYYAFSFCIANVVTKFRSWQRHFCKTFEPTFKSLSLIISFQFPNTIMNFLNNLKEGESDK